MFKISTLINIVDIYDKQRVPLSEMERSSIKGKYPYCGANGIIDHINKYIYDGEYILLAEDGGSYGKNENSCYPMNGKFWVNNHAHVLKAKDNVSINKYVYYALNYFDLRAYIVGSTRVKLNQDKLKNIQIPLPPLPVQRKIAEILGAADAAIEKVDQAIAATERLKKGLMQQLLTKGIGHTQFKNTELGKIPKEWEVVRLGEIAVDFISGGTPSTANNNYWGGNIPWTTSAAISGKYVTKGMRQITKEGLTKSASNIVPKLNILLASRVGIGKVAVNTIDVAISQDLTGILVNKNKAYYDYVYWFLSHNTNLLRSMAQGSTIKGLLRKEIENIYLPLPSLNEQTDISNILNRTLEGLNTLNNKKEYYINIKQSLMSDLLTGKRSVKV